ncbi:Clp protease ClpS [Taibaiella sp. KBW10]|uniref:ATP-dependent Clp protease adaptor ClpS n=1 Tax=Taibaiella sp. KBW10 TaxID=2153357 RepID=UPI000F5AAF4F|nr:ATP-dependent Clp protease adaptor ClpS [Taibaiella sp. KBW10]RQO31175.1 Clp protease ClpS [Taibaiella sp. KBW10]
MTATYRNTSAHTQTDIETDVLVEESVDALHHIVVWNDEVNTFDWVIESLIDICNHTPESAEQCAMIVHYSGKYAVKKGNFDTLKPMCEGLLDRGIMATID